jgi:hypothetical protein
MGTVCVDVSLIVEIAEPHGSQRTEGTDGRSNSHLKDSQPP